MGSGHSMLVTTAWAGRILNYIGCFLFLYTQDLMFLLYNLVQAPPSRQLLSCPVFLPHHLRVSSQDGILTFPVEKPRHDNYWQWFNMFVRQEELVSWLSTKVWVGMERLSITSSLIWVCIIKNRAHGSHSYTGGRKETTMKSGGLRLPATGGRLLLLFADLHLQNRPSALVAAERSGAQSSKAVTPAYPDLAATSGEIGTRGMAGADSLLLWRRSLSADLTCWQRAFPSCWDLYLRYWRKTVDLWGLRLLFSDAFP